MNNKRLTIKIIQGLIVVVFIVSIFQFALPTQAATNSGMSGYYSNPNQDNGKNPYKFKVSDVVSSNLLTNVVGCTGVVNKVATWMARFQASPLQMKKKLQAQKAAAVEQVKAACRATKIGAEFGTSTSPGVTVTEPVKTGFEKWCAENVEGQDDTQIQIALDDQEAAEARTVKDLCFDGIAITLAKNQLTAMTRSAVNWVNSGYGGNPFFIQSMTNFTNGIERNVLETGTDILLDEAFGSPYSRDFARSTVTSYRSGRGIGSSSAGFLGNLQSDLGSFVTDPKSYYSDDQLGQADDTRSAYQRAQDVNNAFSNDFSTGGWNGWLALTQREQNNPLGFTMLASDYLANQQEQQKTAIQNELNQNNGFLSQKTCVKWQVYNEDGKPKTEMNPNYGDGDDTIKPRVNVFTTTKPRTCYKAGGDCCASEADGGWKIITPGSIIKDKTTNYLNSPERQLEMAKTINDSLNALFSVLISKLEGGGLSGLSDNAINNTNWTDNMNDSWTDSSDPYSNNGAYGNFNLTRDLGNTYIHDKTYKVGIWNASTNTTNTTENISLYPDLAPVYHKAPPLSYDDDGIPIYAEDNPPITSNTYFEVKSFGNTKLINEGYNGWIEGDRAFWNGSEWQNWKKDQTSPMKKRGVIQIQQDYIVAAKEIIKVLPSVLTKLGELDYCIPGPNPSYKTNSTDAQSAYQDWIGSMYVGIVDGDTSRTRMTVAHPGERLFDNLANIHNDNPGVWSKILNGMQFLLDSFNSYHYDKNGNYPDDEQNDLDSHRLVAELNIDYASNALFQNFYEVFDKMMNKLYFKNITSVYNESEDKPINFENDKNSGYIPMAESGLDLTKDIYYYNQDYTKAIEEYTSAINQAKINIAKLEPIKAEVSKIIKDAQDRRDAKLIKQINKINQLAIDTCKTEQVECDNSTENVSQCLAEYNICLENAALNGGILTEEQYKTKYKQCLDEEDIQVFDVDQITNFSNYETERCANGYDDDLDGLVDKKDPDCSSNSTGTTKPAHCAKAPGDGETSHTMLGLTNKNCTTQENAVDCNDYQYYTSNNGISNSTDPYIIWSCNWIPEKIEYN